MKVKKVLTPYNVAYSPQEERDPIWLKSEIKYHFELLAALTKEHAQMIEERRALEACSDNLWML